MVWWRTLLLTVFLVALQYPIWWGKGSFRELKLQKNRLAVQKLEVEKLELRNRAMIAQIQDLKEGEDAVAEIAREELGFISKDEHYYRIKAR